MRRMLLGLSIALLTFTAGIATDALRRSFQALTIGHPALTKPEVAVSAPDLNCYPGQSLAANGAPKQFFPHRVLDNREWGDEFRIKWYSRHLNAMNEPSLFLANDCEVESYRFLWLGSFHHPVAVRLSKSGGEMLITVKELDGAGGYEPGDLIINQTRKLSAAEWSEFKRLLESASFWMLPTRDFEVMGNDGAQWILEGVESNRYHVVDRWSPQDGAYYDVCLFMLKISGLGIDNSSRSLY